jgi:hypothetical protein
VKHKEEQRRMENNNKMKQEKQNQNMENHDMVGPNWPHFVEE